MRNFRILLATIILTLGFSTAAYAKCNAKFLNPLTEVCWDCIFPISIGGLSMFTNRPDTQNQAFPFCMCWKGALPYIGLSIGLWEPARLVDVANEPGCFVNIGLDMDFGLFAAGTSTATGSNGAENGSAWQAHYYYYPLISWLGTVVDGLCLETTAFDVAYISEIDPLWNNVELNNLLNPEAILFSNTIAQAACAAECAVASSGNLSMDLLFWCNGCQGSVYPIAGEVNSSYGGVMSSQSVATRLTARMHRLLLAQKTASNPTSCFPTPAPIIPKSQYRQQITRPIANTAGRYACAPMGSSTQYVDTFREFPFKGESFGWLLWRKRNCCAI
ncbi:protein TraU (plasmid) [Maritalea myrionectae]|jgi:conjugal transfer pilus assembly protein TraU|uniref:Protein TraU n=1 Tax=Maritalea myrionectae TaxID=454601 RepID=A0A2R4MJ73_9HYPH|nr:TraU family protein [Maritalea myrionectae]AVX06014.1 protein TraU [Maritalea myrionectae]